MTITCLDNLITACAPSDSSCLAPYHFILVKLLLSRVLATTLLMLYFLLIDMVATLMKRGHMVGMAYSIVSHWVHHNIKAVEYYKQWLHIVFWVVSSWKSTTRTNLDLAHWWNCVFQFISKTSSKPIIQQYLAASQKISWPSHSAAQNLTTPFQYTKPLSLPLSQTHCSIIISLSL